MTLLHPRRPLAAAPALAAAAFFLTLAIQSPASAQESGDSPAGDAPAGDAAPSEPAPQPAANDDGETQTGQTGSGENEREKPEAKPKDEAKKDKAQPSAPAQPALPQPDPQWAKQNVWTEVPAAGPIADDYALVGEYEGMIPVAAFRQDADLPPRAQIGVPEDLVPAGQSGDRRPASLQVTSLGGGRFRANYYDSRLPGVAEDDSMADPATLLGARGGRSVVLAGQDQAMFVSPDRCVIVSPDGGVVAELERVERSSPTLGVAPPEGAVMLFDGQSTDQFTAGEMTDTGLLKAGADVDYLLTDFDLHAEFRIPFMPDQEGQARGNSGLYLQGRYECQVLDSFGLDRVFNGLGAIYRVRPARLNMALPPLVWQTYDVRFTAARFNADGSKRRPAHVSSWVNGTLVQDDVALESKTGHGKDEGPEPLATRLQDHKDPVRYRNIWVIDRGVAGTLEFPVMAK